MVFIISLMLQCPDGSGLLRPLRNFALTDLVFELHYCALKTFSSRKYFYTCDKNGP